MGKIRISEAQWNSHRATIRSLWMTQNMTLAAVMDKMSSEHGFHATKAQYIAQFNLWQDMKKNDDKAFWQGIHAGLKRRHLDVAEVTVYKGDHYLPTKKLKKELKRYTPLAGLQDVNLPATPEGVTILPSTATENHPTTQFAFSVRLELPWYMCIDLCSPSITIPGSLQHTTPPPLSPASSWFNDFVSDDLELFLPSFDFLTPRPTITTTLDTHMEQFPLSPSHSAQFDHTRSDIIQCFGLKNQTSSKNVREELQQYLKPFVVERQPDEMKQAVQELMEPRSFCSFQIMTSYLTLLMSNDLITERATDNFIRKLNALGQLSNFKTLLFGSNATSKAVLNKVLHSTARIGTAEVMEQLLRAGADINSPSAGGKSQTLLQVALRDDNVRVARILIDAGADVNVGCRFKLIDKCYVCQPSFGITKCHCGPKGADSPLALAAKSKYCVDLISSLIGKGAQIPENYPVLQHAIISGAKSDMIRSLINLGADVDQCAWPGPDGPLCAAVSRLDVDMVCILLEAKAHPDGFLDPKLRSKYSGNDHWQAFVSPLMAAAMKGCSEDAYTIAKLLLQHGATCNISILDQESMTTDAMIEIWDLYDHDCEPVILYPLQEAAGQNDLHMVKLLIKYGAQPNTRYGTQALTIASSKANIEVMQYLLDHGADPNGISQHPHCRSPLEAATESSNTEAVSILLRAGAQIDKVSADHGGRTALQRAVELNDQTMTDMLLDHGANIMAAPARTHGVTVIWGFTFYRLYGRLAKALKSTNPNLECRSGMSPLGAAITNRDTVALKMLIGAGASVHEPTAARVPDVYEDEEYDFDNEIFDYKVRSPIQWAAVMGHIEIARLLCDAGADVNQYLGREAELMPLHAAVQQGNIVFVRFLMTREVDLNAYSRNATALAIAAENDEVEIFHLLLRGGANLKQSGDMNSDATMLEKVCRYGQFEMARALLNAGASANYGFPLTACCSSRQPIRKLQRIVKLLLRHGADPNARQFDEHTCLQQAILNEKYKVVPLLLGAGADVNAGPSAETRGTTAIQAAASMGDVDTVELLISRGANVNAEAADDHGVTALQAAAIKGFLRVAQILLEHGADVGAKASLEGGRTSIEGAAEFGRIDMVKLLIDNYRGPMSVAGCCNIARKAAMKGKQWYVLELLDTAYSHVEQQQIFEEFSDESSTCSDD